MLESMFRNLSTEVLVDSMVAYDYYIFAGCDSKLIDTGWTPVGISEFYLNEYQNVWDRDKAENSFDYMYIEGV